MPFLFVLATTSHAAPCTFTPLIVAEPMGSDGIDETCLTVDMDMAGRGFVNVPDDGISRGVTLSRLRTEIGLRAPGDVLTRLAVTQARSGGDDGYVGINGEAFVLQLQIAEARWDWRQTGIAATAGMVDHPWTMAVQGPWQRIDMARPLVTDRGWLPRSDMGGWVSWTGPDRWVSVTVSTLTGEGSNRRERNNGVNVSGLVVVRPLAGSDTPVGLDLAAFVQEGSFGIGQARDHRAAAAAIVSHDVVVGAVEGLLGWGIGGDGTLLPAGVSVWARTGEGVPVVGWVRLDQGSDQRELDGVGETRILAGAGPRLPWTDGGGPGMWVVGYEGRQFGADAAPVAGGDALSATHMVFVQLGARIRGPIPLGGP